MTMYKENGKPVEIDTDVFGSDTEAIALKYADDIDGSRWITSEGELAKLKAQDAPLVYVVNPVTPAAKYEIQVLTSMGHWSNDIDGCDDTTAATMDEALKFLTHLQGIWPEAKFRISQLRSSFAGTETIEGLGYTVGFVGDDWCVIRPDGSYAATIDMDISASDYIGSAFGGMPASWQRRSSNLDWSALGRELRTSADDAHGNDTPSVDFAYQFLLDNPECFGVDEWPADMPTTAPEELQRAYGLVTTRPNVLMLEYSDGGFEVAK